MKNLQPYEIYGSEDIQENNGMMGESSCMSEAAKANMKKICEEHLAKEAAEYHNNDNPEHTYEGYVAECGKYLMECMGQAGYAGLSKPYAE